jgi:hypothetical protein
MKEVMEIFLEVQKTKERCQRKLNKLFARMKKLYKKHRKEWKRIDVNEDFKREVGKGYLLLAEHPCIVESLGNPIEQFLIIARPEIDENNLTTMRYYLVHLTFTELLNIGPIFENFEVFEIPEEVVETWK